MDANSKHALALRTSETSAVEPCSSCAPRTWDVQLQIKPMVNGFSVTDGAFDDGLIRALKDWFSKATIWHTPKWRHVLEASLLDGLNCDAVLNMAMALKDQLGNHLVLENVWAWKYMHNDPSSAYNTSHESKAQILAAIWVDEGHETEGLQLIKGQQKQFIQRQPNRLVLWGADWTGMVHVKGGRNIPYFDRRVDLLMSFERTLGLKLYPGLSESKRWVSKGGT